MEVLGNLPQTEVIRLNRQRVGEMNGLRFFLGFLFCLGHTLFP